MKKLYNLYKQYYQILYLSVLVIIVAVMPHSRGLLSSAQIGLAIMWLLDADFKRKAEILKHRKSILIFCSIFLIHIIGLIYTQNLNYALHDIKIKLPLLLFPIIIGTSANLGLKEIKFIISIFTISILLKTVYGLAMLLGITGNEIVDIQDISGKFSHIRYALLINISIFTNLYILLFSPEYEKRLFVIFRIIGIIWLSVFLIILHSATGWILFMILMIFTGLFILLNSENKVLKIWSISTALVIFIGILLYLSVSVNRYKRTDVIDKFSIETTTKYGNEYKHNFESNEKENGHFVNIFLCDKELKKSWNKISLYQYDGEDDKTQALKTTLIRYLTSKNLKKDQEGINQLSKQDIKNIENGLTNYIFENKYSVYPKIYEILWQFERYKAGGNPENHSVTQRFEFIKIGLEIIKDNFWSGVGTGDIKDAFKIQYEKLKSRLSEKNRLRTHNQYITIFIAFGVFGFIWFLFALIAPGIWEHKFNDYLFLTVFIIFSISMLNEDTLETQMGATTFAFFISLFLFSTPLKLLKK